MKPIVVIVNGYPRSGKDTLCDFAQSTYGCINHSTATTAKKIAYDEMGWDGEKTPKSREMLASLVDLYYKYFDGPYKEMISIIMREHLDEPTTDFIFFHIRKPEEIQRIQEWCRLSIIDCYSVCVVRDEVKNATQTNQADKNVDNFLYDVYISNNGPLEGFRSNSMELFRTMINGDLKKTLEMR